MSLTRARIGRASVAVTFVVISACGGRSPFETYPGRTRADSPLYPIGTRGALGFIDASGSVVVPPTAGIVGAFHDGRARFVHERRWGYLDEATGRVAIAAQFEKAEDFSEGLARVRRGGRCYFIDRTGTEQFACPPLTTGSGPFSEGLAAIEIRGRWGYIDRRGRVVIQPRWSEAGAFHDGLARVVTREPSSVLSRVNAGYISPDGQYVVPLRGVETAGEFSDGFAVYEEAMFGSPGWIDRTGQRRGGLPEGSVQHAFSDGLSVARYPGGAWVALDGDAKVRATFDGVSWVGPFHAGLAVFSSAGELGYLDRSGRVAIAARFDRAEPFRGPLARVEIDGALAYIDRTGSIVWGTRENLEQLASCRPAAIEGLALPLEPPDGGEGTLELARQVLRGIRGTTPQGVALVRVPAAEAHRRLREITLRTMPLASWTRVEAIARALGYARGAPLLDDVVAAQLRRTGAFYDPSSRQVVLLDSLSGFSALAAVVEQLAVAIDTRETSRSRTWDAALARRSVIDGAAALARQELEKLPLRAAPAADPRPAGAPAVVPPTKRAVRTSMLAVELARRPALLGQWWLARWKAGRVYAPCFDRVARFAARAPTTTLELRGAPRRTTEATLATGVLAERVHVAAHATLATPSTIRFGGEVMRLDRVDELGAQFVAQLERLIVPTSPVGWEGADAFALASGLADQFRADALLVARGRTDWIWTIAFVDERAAERFANLLEQRLDVATGTAPGVVVRDGTLVALAGVTAAPAVQRAAAIELLRRSSLRGQP